MTGPRPGDEAGTVPPVALIGPMAAGKSSLGRKLAARIGRTFADTDKLVALEHGPIPQVFAEHGEAAFRRWEAEAVRHALVPGAVVALGGGAVLDERSRALLAHATVVLVTVLQVIASLKIFDQVYLLQLGGPGPENSTRPAIQYIYEAGFTQYRIGYASAMSFVFFLAVIAITLIASRLVRRVGTKTVVTE